MSHTKSGQTIDASEPYFVKIGFTYAHELKFTKKRSGGRYLKLKVRPIIQRRIGKLKKYWKMALK